MFGLCAAVAWYGVLFLFNMNETLVTQTQAEYIIIAFFLLAATYILLYSITGFHKLRISQKKYQIILSMVFNDLVFGFVTLLGLIGFGSSIM